jgi:hypothetical protein
MAPKTPIAFITLVLYYILETDPDFFRNMAYSVRFTEEGMHKAI